MFYKLAEGAFDLRPSAGTGTLLLHMNPFVIYVYHFHFLICEKRLERLITDCPFEYPFDCLPGYLDRDVAQAVRWVWYEY